ncbi:MAG: type II secretion system F family protein [Fimbriimonas sp.]
MRFFYYRATDSAGRTTEGTIRAATSDAAVAALRQGGYQVSAIGDAPVGGAAAPPAVRSAPVATRTPMPNAPLAPRVATAPAPVRMNAPAAAAANLAPAPVDTVKTVPGRDRDLYFLFSQLDSYFRSGVTPAQAFHDLANRAPARYGPSLREMAQRVGESGRMSDVMARYPYLYPPDVVGVMRAGETAGFLPEAAHNIASQMMSSHKLKRRMGFVFGYLLFLAALTPVIYGILQGSLGSIAAQNQVDGALPVVPTLLKYVKAEVIRVLPYSTTALALTLAALYGWHSMPLRELRHRLALKFPYLGKRIWAEAMARFTWASGMISRGGMPPQRVFEMAAESVPNLEIRERLRAAGRSMHETERLSAAIRRTGLLPPEYASIVETGEVTGDVPRALEQVHRAAEVEFESRDRGASRGMIILFMVMIGGLVFIFLALFYRMYFGGLIDIITTEPA